MEIFPNTHKRLVAVCCAFLITTSVFWASPRQVEGKAILDAIGGVLLAVATLGIAPILNAVDCSNFHSLYGGCGDGGGGGGGGGGTSCSANNGSTCPSPANDCDPPETTSGTYDCNGTCSATTAPDSSGCAPPSFGGLGGGSTDPGLSNGPLSSGTSSPFYADPNIVNRGSGTTLYWGNGINHVTKCTVTGGGLSYVGGKTGNIASNPITTDTIFTLTCQNGSGSGSSVHSASIRTRVHINPRFQEI